MLGYLPSLSSPFVAPKLAVLLVAGACGFLGWAARACGRAGACAGRAERSSERSWPPARRFGLAVVVSAVLAAGRGAPGAPYAAVELVRMGAMFGVAVGAAFAARADARNARRLCEAIHASAGLVALIGLCPAPPSLAAADPVDQRPRLDVRQPERRRRGGGDGDPVRLWSARLRRNDRPGRRRGRAAGCWRSFWCWRSATWPWRARAAPGWAARSGWRSSSRSAAPGCRAPPSAPSPRSRCWPSPGRRSPAAGPPTTRATSNGSSRPRAWSATPSIRARRSRAPAWRSGAAPGRSTVRTRWRGSARELPRAFSSLRRAERHRGRRAVADRRPATRPQRSAGAAGRDRAVWSGGAAGALRRAGRRRGSSGPRRAARKATPATATRPLPARAAWPRSSGAA